MKLPPKIETIYAMYDAGNFNACLQDALYHFPLFPGIQSEVMELVIKILSDHHALLTDRTIQAIHKFKETHSLNSILTENRQFKTIGQLLAAHLVGDQKNHNANQSLQYIQAGQAWFPAAATDYGALYLLKVQDINHPETAPRTLSSHERELLDIAGAALFSWLRRSTGRAFLWNPEEYTFNIEDASGKEVCCVEGDSMGAAMVLSLFSLLSGEPVSANTIATAAVNRRGDILPVNSLTQKFTAIKREREHLLKIVISYSQIVPEDPHLHSECQNLPAESEAQFEYVRVRDITDMVELLFGNSTVIRSLHSIRLIDLEKEIETIKRQYTDYMVDTCMENCISIIDHMESKIRQRGKKAKGRDPLLKYLFTCYWKLGACYCHKGDIVRSQTSLRAAAELFKANPGQIDSKDYYNSLNNYGVMLKDIFCYQEAEDIHLEVDRELRKRGVSHEHLSNNLSSLSQLYLADHQYDRAVALQREALHFIDYDDQYRNYGYLAQIYTRMGAFDKASRSLAKAMSLIKNNITKPPATAKISSYYHWIESEYLYLRLKSLKRKPSIYCLKFQQLCKNYDNIDSYVPALINKFCGLGMLLSGERERGVQLLKRSQQYFDQEATPMMKLLGLTARIEKILAWYGEPDCLPDLDIRTEVKKVVDGLSLHKNIMAYFNSDTERLKDLTVAVSGAVTPELLPDIVSILEDINRKIPY